MAEVRLKYSMFISISVLDSNKYKLLVSTVDNVMCIISRLKL